MTSILQILQNIIPAQDNLSAKLPRIAKFGIIAFLIVIAFIIFIFRAQFLMRYMIALLPMFYIAAVLSVGAKKALYGTAVFLFFCFALWVRVGPSYNAVLGGSYVNFQDDANYHMRLIENMVQHFPQRISFDPYTQYPLGETVPFAPFFDFLIALFIWIAGLGHPSLALTYIMGAYYPAVLGALIVIPVYFIGKELFNNRNAGLLAAGLIAIAGGEILNRSLLGFTDHHIAEALFSTTACFSSWQ
jgi:dolichyl-diphosphooligosaccharide--protein glycosyltransferase